MAEVQPINQNAKPIPAGFALIKGRIYMARKVKTLHITLLRLPAQPDDPYAFPPTIEVTSQNPLGKPGEDWEGLVRISGIGRQVQPRPDPDTGEVRDSYRTANNHLRVVE